MRVGAVTAGGAGSVEDTWKVPLATADKLWDKIGDRARAVGETAPAVDEVLTWWNQNLVSVFPAAQEAELARRAVKVLALASLLPGYRAISPREMTDILGTSGSRAVLTADAWAVADVLRRLHRIGPGISRQVRAGGDELDDGYRIGAARDPAADLEEQAHRLAGELAEYPAELARAVIAMCDEPCLPLTRLARETRLRLAVRWQGTDRHGFALLAAPGPVARGALDEMSSELGTTEADYLVIVTAPELTTLPGATTDPDHGDATIAGQPIVVWHPRPIVATAELCLASARWLLASRLAASPGAPTAGTATALAGALESDRRCVAAVVREAYARGQVVGPAGLPELVEGAGAVPFDSWTGAVAVALLEHRFPRHFLVSPGRATVGRQNISSLVEMFLRPGSSGPGAPLPPAVIQLLEQFLQPAGLATRRGRGWVLDVDPLRSEAVRHVLEAAGVQPVAVEELYWRLRKGPFGVSRPCFEILVATLLFSGHLVALSRSRRIPLVRVTGERLDRVSQVVRERPLDAHVAHDLLGLRFLFGRRFRVAPPPLLPRPLWNQILSLRTTSALRLGGLLAVLKRAREETVFAELDLDRAETWLIRLGELLRELDMWGDPHDGLAQLHRRMAATGLLEPLEHVQRVLVFLEQSAGAFLTLTGYLAQPELGVPPGPRFGPLGLELERLRSASTARETCLSRQAFVTFERDVAAFKAAYGSAYAADHAEHAGCVTLAPSRLATRATCACGHRLGDASRGSAPPVRDLAALTGRLAGQTVSRDELFAVVAEWFGRELDDTTRVRIAGGVS